MNYHFLIPVTIAVLLVLAGPAAAQSADDIPDQNETTTEPTAHERIDKNTQLVDARLEDETAVIVLKSETTQRVQLTDWGQFMRGGEVVSQSYIVKGGERTTIRHPVLVKDGFAGVSITTREAVWSVPLEDPYVFLPGGATTSDVQLAGLTGLATTGLLAIGIAIKKRRGLGDTVERLV